jgi:hypothetical protein
LTYRINDPIRYVFSFVNASNAVQSALDNALLYAASRFKVDDILTRDIAGFQEAVRRRATQLVENQDLGVVVEQCVGPERPAAAVEGRLRQRAQGRSHAQQGAQRGAQL